MWKKKKQNSWIHNKIQQITNIINVTFRRNLEFVEAFRNSYRGGQNVELSTGKRHPSTVKSVAPWGLLGHRRTLWHRARARSNAAYKETTVVVGCPENLSNFPHARGGGRSYHLLELFSILHDMVGVYVWKNNPEFLSHNKHTHVFVLPWTLIGEILPPACCVHLLAVGGNEARPHYLQ